MKSINKIFKFPQAMAVPLVCMFALVFFLMPKTSLAYGVDDIVTSIKALGSSLSDTASFVAHPIDSTLRAILQFDGVLLSMAEAVFTWIVDPQIFTSIMNNPTIYTLWTTVRDLFNFLFIMVLLFSAFATVFQIDKYGYQKIVFHLVLMALLVNFSFPIARFIMDASNIVMYSLASNMKADTLVTQLVHNSQTQSLLTGSADTVALISAIIFLFILSISLLMIGVLLLIRVITLAIYLIFAPIGFAGTILPGTKLSKVADDWWSNFMKYCFSGPTMLIMLYVATKMLGVVSDGKLKEALDKQAKITTVPGLYGVVTGAVMSLIPVIIIWYGITTAQESGAAGAKGVIGAGKKFLTATGKKLSGADWAKRNYDAFSAERKRRADEKNKYTRPIGAKLGAGTNHLEDRLAGKVPFFGRAAKERESRMKGETDATDAKNYADKYNIAGKNNDELKKLLGQAGTRHGRAAILQEMANRKQLKMSDPTIGSAYERFKHDFEPDNKVFQGINNKLKESDPVTAFSHIKNNDERQKRMTEYINSPQFDATKLDATPLGNDEFMETAFREGAITNDDLEKLRKKSPTHERNILASLGNITGRFANISQTEREIERLRMQPASDARDAQITELDNALRVARSAQTAHFAQTGNFHASLSEDATLSAVENATRQASRAHIISRLGTDTSKRLRINTGDPAQDERLRDEFLNNLNSNKFKAIVSNVDMDGQVATGLVNRARALHASVPPGAPIPGTTAPGRRNVNKIMNDTDLQNM